MNSSKTIGVDENAFMEILLRLPIKSVTRFQIVCKRWISVISSDHFRRLHALRHHKPPQCLILATVQFNLFCFNLITKLTMMIPSSITIPNYPKISAYPKVCSSCNGLLLLRDGSDCHVYNPITKQSRKISLQAHSDTYIFIELLHLVFEPSQSQLPYRIVCIRSQRMPLLSPWAPLQTCKMEVFNPVSGIWEVCREPITVSTELDLDFSSGVYYNNMIYGILKHKHSDDDGSLYCFDIDKNVLRFLTGPTAGMPRAISRLSLQESNGYLYYICIYEDDLSLRLWEKSKRGDDEWSLKHTSRVQEVRRAPALIRFVAQTITLFIPASLGWIKAYNLVDKSCNVLRDWERQLPYNERAIGPIHMFCETLAPV